MVYVVAGNHAQFQHFQRQRRRYRDIYYVSSLKNLIGLNNPTVTFVGTYWEHHEYNRILEDLEARGYTNVKPENVLPDREPVP